MTAEGRSFARHQNVRAAIGLAAYHHDHGRYPKQLSQLRPKYMKQLPTVHYSGKPLIYKPTDDGYLVYSVGPNGKDDNGHSLDGKGDDMILRVPDKSK